MHCAVHSQLRDNTRHQHALVMLEWVKAGARDPGAAPFVLVTDPETGEVSLDVNEDWLNLPDTVVMNFLNVHPAPGVSEVSFNIAIEAGKEPRVISAGSMLVPIKQAIASLNKAGAVVRRIESGTDEGQPVKGKKYISLEVTFGIGGVDVPRAVQIRIAQDPDSKVWSIASRTSALRSRTRTRRFIGALILPSSTGIRRVVRIPRS